MQRLESQAVHAGGGNGAPVVSVLMLAYNHGPYIRESVQSILAQRVPFNFELIIGEDCSPDNTRAVAEQLAADHPETIRLITSEKNVGMHANGRRLEEAVRGRYVAYCEADDYWHDPDKLALQVSFLESHPDYVMTHTDYRLLDVGTGRIIPSYQGRQDVGDDGEAYAALISGRRVVGTLTVCLRAAALHAIRKQPECYDNRFLMGDTQRWLEVSRLGKVRYFREVTATRRALAESATRSQHPGRVLRFQKSARDLLEHYISKYPPPPDAVRVARRRTAMTILKWAWAAGDQNDARREVQVLSSLNEGIPLVARLYQFGSKSAAHRRLATPFIRCLRLVDAIARRMRRRTIDQPS